MTTVVADHAKKKKPEEHVNHERWMVSYADFITLLFAFFVMMYSISVVNTGKFKVLSESLTAAFQDPNRSLEPIQIGELVARQQIDPWKTLRRMTLRDRDRSRSAS